MKFALEDLRTRGIKRAIVNPVTDLRVAKMWRRIGFREVAVQMVYDFEGN